MNDTPAPEAPGGDEPTTLTVKPVHFAGVLLAVVIFAGGFWLARSRAPEPAPVAASIPTPFIQVLPPSSSLGSMSPEIDPGVVMPAQGDSPMLGQPAVDIAGTTLDGQRISLAELKGKPVMLNFWATWCPPCRVEMPWMQEVYDAHKDSGFTILAVDAGEKISSDMVLPTVTNFIQSSGFTFPVMLPDDPYTPQVQYSVYGLPSTYMISPDGVVMSAHRGMFPNRATINARVEELLAAPSQG